MKKIEKVNIVGMGALGMLFGRIIAENIGYDRVCFVMDEARAAKYKNRDFFVNGEKTDFTIKTDSEAEICDLLIVAVKSTGLESALETMASSVGDDTIIVSVLNGIVSENIIGNRYGMEKMIHSVALGMDAMHFGTELSYSCPGMLCIGNVSPATDESLRRVAEFFTRSGVAYSIEEDIIRKQWSKLMINVGINQTCMIYETGYAGAVEFGSMAYMTFVSAMREVILVAAAEGIVITEQDIKDYLELIKTFRPDATPSMGQDRINRHHSEVEIFAGTVISIAGKHGIPVPTNDFIYKRVKEIEAEY